MNAKVRITGGLYHNSHPIDRQPKPSTNPSNDKHLRELLSDAVSLIDDICQAYKFKLLADDQELRDLMEKEGVK